MKKFKYVSALLAALGMCGVMGYTPEAWGQESGEESDDALPPLVMVVFDTSTSMDEKFVDGYTRLTKAVAEIAGDPKVDNHTYFTTSTYHLPHAYRDCSSGTCKFETECIQLDGKVAKVPCMYSDSTRPCDTYKNCQKYKDTYYDDYYENGVIHAYMNTVKFGFAGFVDESSYSLRDAPIADGSTKYYSYRNFEYMYGHEGHGHLAEKTDSKTGWRYGVKIDDDYKYKGSGCVYAYSYSGKYHYDGKSYYNGSSYYVDDRYGHYGSGIYTADKEAKAPTIYPTVSDDEEEIEKNNRAVLTSIRAYFAESCTPIGPALADLYYMFTNPDPGIIAQPIGEFSSSDEKKSYGSLSGLVGTVDEKYECRKKAVILISDGVPQTGYSSNSASSKGQYTDVWHDAERLFKAGVRVYTVLYAQASGTVDISTGIGDTMNRIAWKGGTCRDEHGNPIAPDDETSYKALVNAKRSCMFNAGDGSALRSALVTVLSDMLEGTKSKTAVATTTAIGQKQNVEGSTWNNGYYNVYSGYKVTMGPVRDTVLQRTAIVCDHQKGQFVVDDDQYLDLTKRLKCRIRGSDMCGSLENTGYEARKNISSYTPAGCVTKNVSYAANDLPEAVQLITNTCLNERYLFTANYVDVGSDNAHRYAISTFGNTMNILKNIHINDANVNKAGLLKKSLNTKGVESETTAVDANFLLSNNTATGASACSEQMKKTYSEQVGKPNYILSPYECGTDFDCGTVGDDNKPRYCDLGRCIDPGKFASNQDCDSNVGLSSGKVCVGKYWRQIYDECSTHNDCLNKKDYGHGYVCHAGRCLPGTVKDCDIRDFMASIPLGTIEYATPVTMVPPTKAYKSLTYKKFSTRYWRRDAMLMVAANDGMLHAFVLGDNNEAGDYKSGLYNLNDGLEDDSSVNLVGHSDIDKENHEGDELWAFIPKMSYKDLYQLVDFGDQEFLNASPKVVDVQLPGFTIDGDSWRTVVVGGFRDGGRGYYALDITNPAKPFVLWEIDHQWQPWKYDLLYPSVYENSPVSLESASTNRQNLQNEKGYPFQLMGKSYAEPVITNLLIDGKVQPVAILAGGNSLNDDPEDMVGRSLYIVKLFPESKEDLIVKIFYFNETITGTPEVYPNNFNSLAQHIYVGDAKGALYRLDVSADFNSETKYEDISEWASYNAEGGYLYGESSGADSNGSKYRYEKPIFMPSQMSGLGTGYYSPITFKPAVSLLGYIGENKSLPTIQITFGTGSNDNFNVTGGERHYVASFVDVPQEKGYQLNPVSAPCFKPQIIIFNANEDSSVGTGKYKDTKFGTQEYMIYKNDPLNASNIETHQKMTGAPITHNFTSYFPTFVANSDSDNICISGHANIWRINGRETCSEIKEYNKPLENVQNKQNADVFASSSVEALQIGTKVYGLEITNQMYCIADCKSDDPNCKGNNVLAPQLIAQTGGETASLATDEGSKKLTSGKVEVSSLAINLEAFKPEVSRVTWAGVYE